MSERFLKYETEHENPLVDKNGVLTKKQKKLILEIEAANPTNNVTYNHKLTDSENKNALLLLDRDNEFEIEIMYESYGMLYHSYLTSNIATIFGEQTFSVSKLGAVDDTGIDLFSYTKETQNIFIQSGYATLKGCKVYKIN